MTGRGSRTGRRKQGRDNVQHAAPYIQRRIGTLNVLSEEGLELIESNADQILVETGMEFRDDPEILAILPRSCARHGDRLSCMIWIGGGGMQPMKISRR